MDSAVGQGGKDRQGAEEKKYGFIQMRHCLPSSNESYQKIPVIGHASPQYERAVLTLTPTQPSGVVKSTNISCQSLEPVGYDEDLASSLSSFAFMTSSSGVPALFRFSVRTQNRSR